MAETTFWIKKQSAPLSRCRLLFMWGGRWDSNPRSSVPQTDALGQLRYTHHIGAPEGTRTPGPLLRRQVLYPAELQAPVCPIGRNVERVMGIEPTQPAWKAGVLPLNYTRISARYSVNYDSICIPRCQVEISHFIKFLFPPVSVI